MFWVKDSIRSNLAFSWNSFHLERSDHFFINLLKSISVWTIHNLISLRLLIFRISHISNTYLSLFSRNIVYVSIYSPWCLTVSYQQKKMSNNYSITSSLYSSVNLTIFKNVFILVPHEFIDQTNEKNVDIFFTDFLFHVSDWIVEQTQVIYSRRYKSKI